MRATDRVTLSVGREELVLESDAERVSERKVDLPERWVRGLGEAAAIQSRMEPVIHLQRVAAMRFLSGLPSGRPKNEDVWLLPSGSAVRSSRTPQPRESVCVACTPVGAQAARSARAKPHAVS